MKRRKRREKKSTVGAVPWVVDGWDTFYAFRKGEGWRGTARPETAAMGSRVRRASGASAIHLEISFVDKRKYYMYLAKSAPSVCSPTSE